MGSSRTSSSRKKSKQSRKVKKELRRLKRKNDKKERFGLFSGKIAWTLALCFNSALGAAVPEDGYSLAKAAEDGSLIGRISNSLALAQGIKEGKLDELAMAKELLDMDADQSIEKLQTENYQSIQKQIEGAIAVMDTQCANGKCVDVQKIERGLTTVEDTAKFSSEKIKPTLKTLENLEVVRRLYLTIIELISAAATYEDLIKKTQNIKKEDALDVVTGMRKVVPLMVNAEETFKKAIEDLKKVSAANPNYEEQFNLIIPFETEILGLKEKTEVIDFMVGELKELQKLVKEMRRFLSKDDIEPVIETINLLLQFVRNPKIPIDKKTLTPGFPRGLEDLKKIPDDLKAPLKDILADGKSSDKLKDFLKDAIDTKKQFEPLVSIADAKTVIYAIEQKIENVQKELQAAYTDISRTDVFDKLLDCFGTEFGIKIRPGAWSEEKNNFVKNKQAIENFIISVTTSKVSPFAGFNEIKTFCKNIDMKENDMDKAYKDIASYPNLNTVTSEVDQFKKTFSSGNHGKLGMWIDHSSFGSIINNTRKLVNEVDFSPLIKCFNKDNILDASKKIMKEGQLLSSLFKINSKNQNFKAFFNALSAMKKPSSDWSNFRKQRKVREASGSPTPIILDKPFDIAKKFGIGVKALLDFAVADEVLSAMKTILNNQSVIDSEITTLKDDEQKTKISKVWNENTKKILKEIVDFVEKMKKSTGKKPTRLADFKEVFEAYGSDVLPNFNGRELSHLLSFIQNDKNIEASLKSLGSLNLEFSSSKKKLSVAGSTLDPLEKFFDGFFGIVRATSDVTQDGTDNDEQNTDEGGSMSTAVIVILAVFGVLLVFAAIGGGYFTIKKYRERRARRALLKKMKDNAKKDQENAHIKTEPQKKVDNPKKEDKNEKKPEKKEKSHPPTIEIETMTVEQFKTELRTKKPKKKQAKEVQVDEKTAVKEFEKKKKEFLKNFKTVHGFECRELTREVVVGKAIYNIKFESDDKRDILAKKYNNAIDLAEQQQVIDNEAFDQNREKEDYQIPDMLSHEDVKMLMRMRPEKGNWTTATIHHNGIKREYKVSTATDVVTRLKELIDRRDGDDPPPSLAATQSCPSLSRKPSDLKTAVSIKDPNYRAATSGDRREDVEAAVKLLSTSVDVDAPVDPVHLESQQQPKEKPGIFQRLCNRYMAGADEDPYDFGFSKRPFQKDNEDYLITQFRAALSKKFRVIDSCYDFGSKHPITEDMFEPLLELTKGKVSTESAILKLDSKNMRVVGDIHGKYADFVRQVFDILVDETAVGVFLGDYVDRGFRSVDVVYLLCLLKCLFPEKFFFLRGNHETRQINTNYELKEECKAVFKERGPHMQEKMNQFFDHFPLGAEFHEKIFLAHGGISEHMLKGREVLNKITKTPKTVEQWNLFYDILWCDLVYFYKSEDDKRSSVFTRSKRCAYAKVCNQNGLNEVMDKMGWLLVIRGHEVKTAGYEYFSERRAVTIFGSTQNSNNNMAVQLILSDAGNLTMYRHDCIDEDPNDDDNPTIAA